MESSSASAAVVRVEAPRAPETIRVLPVLGKAGAHKELALPKVPTHDVHLAYARKLDVDGVGERPPHDDGAGPDGIHGPVKEAVHLAAASEKFLLQARAVSFRENSHAVFRCFRSRGLV